MGVVVQNFINDAYNANTYLIANTIEKTSCYLVDVGNAKDVLSALASNQYIKAIFLTHSHYDHICGIYAILEQYPNCLIYCSSYTKLALADAKLNLSFYHGTPIAYAGPNVLQIDSSDSIDLFDGIRLQVMATPGHNEGCLTFKINQALFTGDSLIPGTAVVTKLKSGNKTEARQSICKIKKIARGDVILYPGHGNAVPFGVVDWDFYL